MNSENLATATSAGAGVDPKAKPGLRRELIGLKAGKWTENCGAIAVALLGMLLIAAAAVHWKQHGSATAIHLTPRMDWGAASFWAAIAFGITGAEYFGMMSAEIRSPERTVKPALWRATAFVAIFDGATTLALLVLLRPEMISDMRGIADGGEAGRPPRPRRLR